MRLTQLLRMHKRAVGGAAGRRARTGLAGAGRGRGRRAWSWTGRDCRYQSFIASAPSGRSSRNHECTLISAMVMRSPGSATSSRASRSRHGADTCAPGARAASGPTDPAAHR